MWYDRSLAKISKKLQIKWNFELAVFKLTVPYLYSFDASVQNYQV